MTIGRGCTHVARKNIKIDHLIVNREMSHRVRDAGITACILDSDHRALFIKLKVMKRLKKKPDPRRKMINLDSSVLSSATIRDSFCESIAHKVYTSTSNEYEVLSDAIKTACQETFPSKTKNQPGWFQANSAKLLPLIQSRNQAMANNFRRSTRSTTNRLRLARKKLKAMVIKSKNDWILSHCMTINHYQGTKQAWDSLKTLKCGLSKPKPSVSRQMKKSDGTFCTTPQENATVFYEHFNHLYNREPNFDATVLDTIPHHDTVQGCDHEPTDDEIRKAIQKLKNTSPGESGIQPQIWKCLIDNPSTGQLLTDLIRSI